jgi:hypothetical protein
MRMPCGIYAITSGFISDQRSVALSLPARRAKDSTQVFCARRLCRSADMQVPSTVRRKTNQVGLDGAKERTTTLRAHIGHEALSGSQRCRVV